jgi:hypothetical protein
LEDRDIESERQDLLKLMKENISEDLKHALNKSEFLNNNRRFG